MIRRRLIIEWDDDTADTNRQCAQSFINGDWDYQDLYTINEPDNSINLKLWVEDAPKENTP